MTFQGSKHLVVVSQEFICDPVLYKQEKRKVTKVIKVSAVEGVKICTEHSFYPESRGIALHT